MNVLVPLYSLIMWTLILCVLLHYFPTNPTLLCNLTEDNKSYLIISYMSGRISLLEEQLQAFHEQGCASRCQSYATESTGLSLMLCSDSAIRHIHVSDDALNSPLADSTFLCLHRLCEFFFYLP
jgi:hypothetical protein